MAETQLDRIEAKIDRLLGNVGTGVPTPTEILLADQWKYVVPIEVPGLLDWAEISLEIQPNEVRGLHGLAGIWADTGNQRLWANRSANGRLFVETAASSTPGAGRPSFLFEPDNRWTKHVLNYGKEIGVATIHDTFFSPSARVPIDRTVVNRSITFAFGSTVEEERWQPNHKSNVGWRIRNIRMRWSVGGVEGEKSI
jgi:hypothetical protein